MGDVQGPQKVNDTYVKTMHAGLTDRSFTVSHYTMGCVATFRDNEISQTVYQTCHLLDSYQTGFKKCLKRTKCVLKKVKLKDTTIQRFKKYQQHWKIFVV